MNLRCNSRVAALLAAAALGGLAATSMAQNVVISQIYGGGGATTGTPTYTHDYVELLNTGPASVDINGWSLQYAAATGSTWSGAGTTVLATTSTILQPGQYYLVRLGTATGALGAALPVAHDASGTTAMSATAGKVAVVNSSTPLTGTCPTGVVDLVGYGTTANCREPFSSSATADNAPAPTNSGFGLLRVQNGCFDSNRNRFDFVNAANTVPRNSLSAFASCTATPEYGVSVTGGACPTTVGASVTYTFTVTNGGTASGGFGLVVSYPAGLSFTSSTPAPDATAPGTLTFLVLGGFTPGATATFDVNFTVAAAGSHTISGAVSGTGADPISSNDTVVSGATFVPATSATLAALYSNLSSAANSTVPAGASSATQFLFSTSTGQDIFGRPWVSSDGRWMIVKTKNSLGTSLDDMLIRYDLSNDTATVVAQEGATDLGGGELLGVIDFEPTINTAGDFAYSVETTAAATADDVAVVNIGGANTVIGREGANDGFGTTIATSVTAWSILNNGNVLWGHLLNSTAANDLETLILHSGSPTIAARANDTATTPAPTNQVGGTTFPWKLFNSGSDFEQVSQMSPDGANLLIHGDLEGGTTDPDAVALNGAIIVMDGQTLGSVPGTVTAINGANLRGSHWSAYGATNTGDDWVLVDGNVVARLGGPITTGSMEVWGDTSFPDTFFIAATNNNGDYIVGGVTSAADANANAVLVLNGTTVVARENDPVDLNANGVFDDDAFIRTFRDGRIHLTDSRVLIFAVETRSAAGYCSGNPKTADALVRVQLPQSNGACCDGSICSSTSAAACTGPNTLFAGAGTTCNIYPASTSPCCFADYNHVGGITVQDIFDFLAAYFSSAPNADINGASGISVQDIFDFLAAYFAGGC